MKTTPCSLHAAILAASILTVLPLQGETLVERWLQNYEGLTGYDNYPIGLAVDGVGQIAVAGTSLRTDLAGGFIAKYSLATGAPVWVQDEDHLGPQDFSFSGLTVDAAGNVYVAGISALDEGADYQAYVGKYAAADGAVVWSQFDNATAGSDSSGPLVLDGSGGLVVGGGIENSLGIFNAHTVKYNQADGTVLWVNDSPVRFSIAGIGADSSSDIVVGGLLEVSFGDNDLRVEKYAAADGSLLWAVNLDGGTGGYDSLKGIVVDGADNVIVTGTAEASSGTLYEYLTAKYSSAGTLLWEKHTLGPVGDPADFANVHSVTVDANDDVLVTGDLIYWSPSVRYATYTVKYAGTNGALLWDRVEDWSGPLYLNASTVKVDDQGDAVIHGSLQRGEAAEQFVMKYDGTTGATIYQKIVPDHRFGYSGFAGDRMLGLTAGGGVVVTGRNYQDNQEATMVAFLSPLGSEPGHEVYAAKGDHLPPVSQNSVLPPPAKWRVLGSPAISEAGQIAFTATWRTVLEGGDPPVTGRGVFVNGLLTLASGNPLTPAGSEVWKNFKAPVVSNDGTVAVVGTATGGTTTTANDSAVATARVDDPEGTYQLVAREGDVAPDASGAPDVGGAQFKAFTSVGVVNVGTEPEARVYFDATLSGAVTTLNDRGVWMFTPSGGLVELIREGRTGLTGLNPGESLKSYLFLNTLSGSAGQGRGLSPSVGSWARWQTSAGRQLAVPGSGLSVAATGQSLNSTTLPGAIWNKVGQPSVTADGTTAVLSGILKTGAGGVTGATASGIFATTSSGSSWEPLAREGGAATGFGAGAVFAAFEAPVQASDHVEAAFLATAQGGAVTAVNDTGIWRHEGGVLSLVAREGGVAPDAPVGSVFGTFANLSLPGGTTGPVFTGTLQVGPGGITSSNDEGCWAVTSGDVLRELFREGTVIEGKVVTAFNILQANGGSQGVTRSFNHENKVIWLATFADGSTAVVQTYVP